MFSFQNRMSKMAVLLFAVSVNGAQMHHVDTQPGSEVEAEEARPQWGMEHSVDVMIAPDFYPGVGVFGEVEESSDEAGFDGAAYLAAFQQEYQNYRQTSGWLWLSKTDTKSAFLNQAQTWYNYRQVKSGSMDWILWFALRSEAQAGEKTGTVLTRLQRIEQRGSAEAKAEMKERVTGKYSVLERFLRMYQPAIFNGNRRVKLPAMKTQFQNAFTANNAMRQAVMPKYLDYSEDMQAKVRHQIIESVGKANLQEWLNDFPPQANVEAFLQPWDALHEVMEAIELYLIRATNNPERYMYIRRSYQELLRQFQDEGWLPAPEEIMPMHTDELWKLVEELKFDVIQHEALRCGNQDANPETYFTENQLMSFCDFSEFGPEVFVEE